MTSVLSTGIAKEDFNTQVGIIYTLFVITLIIVLVYKIDNC